MITAECPCSDEVPLLPAEDCAPVYADCTMLDDFWFESQGYWTDRIEFTYMAAAGECQGWYPPTYSVHWDRNDADEGYRFCYYVPEGSATGLRVDDITVDEAIVCALQIKAFAETIDVDCGEGLPDFE